ncbi:GNAT family N-acetyltransferase [bacterium]|nr:GNAT family N-acetyltransferase [bacterium]
MNVSFKASLVGYATVIKRNNNTNKESGYISSFVELDKANNDDYEALRQIALGWNKGYSYAKDVFDNFSYEKFGKKISNDANYRYFALTKHSSPFNKLNADSILGVATLREEADKTFTLEHLQVAPMQEYTSPNRKFKHIGQAILKTILDKFINTSIKLYAVDSDAEAFYKKLGFKNNKKSIYMIFKR